MKRSEASFSVYAAIAGNFLIAAVKFFAAAKTGSSAMISEGIHSLVDTGDGFLLLLGERRARKKADQDHPFGYGKEVYFWSLAVAILIFALGGGMSVYEGIQHILHPEPMQDNVWNYAILGFSFVAEGTSFTIALRTFSKHKRSRSYWRAIRASKDPTVFTVLFEDSAALIGLVIAGVCITLAQVLENPYLDGTGSVLIGLVLASVAFLLARESKDLLVGEGVRKEVRVAIEEMLAKEPNVQRTCEILSMHFGPHQILLAVHVRLRPGLQAEEIWSWLKTVKRKIKNQFPDIHHVFIETEPPDTRSLSGTAK